MKKNILFLIAGFLLFANIIFVSSTNAAPSCNLQVSLVNQDPYPAIPGSLLKLVFQIDGIESTNCKDVELSLIESFPFRLDPSSEKLYQIKSGTYNNQDYKTFFQAPFRVQVDSDASNGEKILEVRYRSSAFGGYVVKQFKIEVKDFKTDFEVFVKNYDYATQTLDLQILNIGKEDVSAVSIEIPSQEGITVRGTNKNIIGDLDSKEDTVTDFKTTIEAKEFLVNVAYTDFTGERRIIEEKVSFESAYFIHTKDSGKGSLLTYFFYIVIAIIVIYFIYKKFFKKKKSTKLL